MRYRLSHIFFRKSTLPVCLVILLIFTGCDFISPKKSFVLAIPQKDISYNYAAGHLKSFLEEGGYSIEIRKVETAIEANRLVAEGKADLTFILNHSLFIPQTLHDHGAKLRTIAPLFRRLLFLFTKNGETEGPVRNIFTNKTVKLEVLEGETHRNLMQMLNEAALDSVNYSDSGPGDSTIFGEHITVKEPGIFSQTDGKELVLTKIGYNFCF